MSQAIVRMENVNKYYGTFHVLKNINFSVTEGEIVVICGPSGSGKSTLIRCINKLEEIDSGEIIIDDRFFQESILYIEHFSIFWD